MSFVIIVVWLTFDVKTILVHIVAYTHAHAHTHTHDV